MTLLEEAPVAPPMPPQATLDQHEAMGIEKLLVDAYRPGFQGEEEVSDDIEELKRVTAEIKSVAKQAILLQGERIYRAREILKKYGDESTTFTKWIEQTFGNRRTVYNILSYYELSKSLSSPGLREKMKRMPLQAVYTLASRCGPMRVKEDIISNYNGEKQKETILLIQELLPTAEGDRRRRKEANSCLLEQAENLFETLEKRRDSLTNDQEARLLGLLSKLNKKFN